MYVCMCMTVCICLSIYEADAYVHENLLKEKKQHTTYTLLKEQEKKIQYAHIMCYANLQKNEAVQLIYLLKKS